MVDDSIRVRLIGGLGNQIFQYFGGLYAANLLEKSLIVDTRWLDGEHSHRFSDIRNFKFFSPERVITSETNGKIFLPFERIKNKLVLEISILSKLFLINHPKNPGYFDFTGMSTGVELRGYYQSYSYFENIEAKSGKLSWELTNFSGEYLKLLTVLKEEPFIAVHVRGGDYRQKRNIYHELATDYYSLAISELRKKKNITKVIVFTDDLHYARELFRGFKFIFQDQSGLNASESMILMAMAEGIVIANSTFSYWSAVINGTNEIIAPSLWYKNRKIEKDFYPKNWSII